MLTNEEFTELVFGGASPRAGEPEFRQQAFSWRVDYGQSSDQEEGTTYFVNLVSSVDNASFTAFTVTTWEEGYEEELVRATQEFVARFSSLNDLRNLIYPPKPCYLDEDLGKLWDGDNLKEGYTPLERLLLAGVSTSSLSVKGIKHLFAPQEALSYLPTQFTLSRKVRAYHYSLLGTLTLPEEGEDKAPDPLVSEIYRMGTPETKAALEEVVAFGSSLKVKAEHAWVPVISSLFLLTPWHPEQRPEGVAYADLFALGEAGDLAFLALLENNFEEDLYLGLRWVQAHWHALPQPKKEGVEEVSPPVIEWASPLTTAGRRQFSDALLYLEDLSPASLLFLQALLPHRSEFTEEERLRLLALISYYSSDDDEEGVSPAVVPSYNRLLDYLLGHLGPMALARLFITWPEGENSLSQMEEGVVLASHPEWWDLPPTWWLPLLRAETAGREGSL